jgi:hypothetical protein
MNGRNELYPDPFDEFDPHHTVSGRKAFNPNERCLKANIDLKNYVEELPKKVKNKVSVNQSFLDDFDRMYRENCDNRKMAIKARGISVESSFHKSNVRPSEHLMPEKILEKPCHIKDLSIFIDKKPLAGKFSEIGEQIFTAGNKKAGHITTGPWG